jgi:hypothetical protein
MAFRTLVASTFGAGPASSMAVAFAPDDVTRPSAATGDA